MTRTREPDEQEQAQALQAYGDALVDGVAPPPLDDLEATMRHVQRNLTGARLDSGPIPPTIRTAIWEELMDNAMRPVDATPLTTLNAAPPSLRNVVPPPRNGWTSIASFGLVLVVLAALVATLVVRQERLFGPNDLSPTELASQGVSALDDDSPNLIIPAACVSNGEVTSDADLAQRSITDWTAPAYAPAAVVTEDTGEAILATYMNYLRCERERFDSSIPPGSTPTSGTPVPQTGPSTEMLSYFSDRLRYDRLYSELSPDQQDALDTYRCEPRNTTVLETFPLPVNQPQDYALWSNTSSVDDAEARATVFRTSDVYLLPDGRYGVVIGRITTAALTDPNAVTMEDHLLFVAFAPEDGRYYIDEIFTISGPMLDDLNREGRNGTLVTNCD